MDKFKTELDIQKAHFKATRDRASGEYEAWKARRLRDIEEIRSRMNVTREDAGEKVEGFRDEMLASLQHMRAAFKKLW